MQCQKCGTNNPDNARFCRKCGAQLHGGQASLKNFKSEFSPLSSDQDSREERQTFAKGQDGLRQQPEQKKKKKWAVPVIAAIAVGAFLLGFLMNSSDGNPEPQANQVPAAAVSQEESTVQMQKPTQAKETEAVIQEIVWTVPETREPEKTVPVQENHVIRAPEELVLRNFDPMGKNPKFFGTKLRKTDIESITFLDSLDQAPQDAVDVSESRSGRVLLWYKNGYEGKEVYIGGDGKVFLPRNSSFLFGSQYNSEHEVPRYDILEQIVFNSAVDTSQVKDMCAMFQFCGRLKGLDLRDFDTSNTEDMSYMFCGCKSLENLDISSFETGNVKNMSTMFNGCESLENLDVSNFDTRNVSLMTWMFGNCRGLTLLDLSNMRTDSVKFSSTGCMFKGCTEYFQIITNDSILRDRYDVFLEKLPD